MVGGLGKNFGHYVGQNYTGSNALKQSQKKKKKNLNQKINDFVFDLKQKTKKLIFGIYLSISDFLAECLKANKN